MKILCVLYEDFRNGYQPALDKLQAAGHDIQVVEITPPLWQGQKEIRGQYDVITRNKASLFNQSYDVAIWIIHETSGIVKGYQRSLNLKHGHLSVEHDILSAAPQTTDLCPGHKSIGTYAFQKVHKGWLERNTNRPIIEAKWYKNEIPKQQIDVSQYSPDEDLGYIGVVNRDIAKSYEMNKPLPLPDGLFRKQWYKTWLRPDYLKAGTSPLTDKVFLDSVGGIYLDQVAKFWVTGVTSTYLDILLLDCIPLVQVTDRVSINEKVDETFNRVRVSGTAPFLGILVDDKLEEKVKRIRSDKDYHDHVLRTLKAEWFQEDYDKLPNFSDSLIDHLKKYE